MCYCFVEVVGVVIVRYQVSVIVGKFIEEVISVMMGKYVVWEDFWERWVKVWFIMQIVLCVGVVYSLFGVGKIKFNYWYRDIKFRVVLFIIKLQLFYI